MEKRAIHSTSLEQEQETLWYLGGLRIIAALGEQASSSPQLLVYEEPSGTFVSSYSPRPEEVAFYLIEGEVTFHCAGTTISATPGTFVFLPRNLSFHRQVSQAARARLITWTTSSGFAHQVICMGRPGQALVLAPPMSFTREKMYQITAALLKRVEKPLRH